MVKLMSGNGAGQAIQFFSLVVLSRIYDPGSFGDLAQIQSVATIFVIFMTMQLHLSMPLKKNEDEVRVATGTIELIACLWFVILFMGSIIVGQFNLATLIIALTLAFSNTYIANMAYGGNFGRISKYYLFRALGIVVSQIVLSFTSTINGLVWGVIIGELIGMAYLALGIYGSGLRPQVNFSAAIHMIKHLRAFTLYGTMQELISVLAFYLPLFLFSYKYGDGIGGQYAMANRIVWAPVVLFSGSFALVLSRVFSNSSSANILAKIRHYLNIKTIAGLLVFAGLSFFCEKLYVFALGKQWELAAKFITLQLICGIFFIFSTPFRVLCRLMFLQKIQLTIDFFVIAFLAFIFYTVDASPVFLMWSLLVVYFLQNFLLSTLVLKRLKKHEFIGQV